MLKLGHAADQDATASGPPYQRRVGDLPAVDQLGLDLGITFLVLFVYPFDKQVEDRSVQAGRRDPHRPPPHESRLLPGDEQMGRDGIVLRNPPDDRIWIPVATGLLDDVEKPCRRRPVLPARKRRRLPDLGTIRVRATRVGRLLRRADATGVRSPDPAQQCGPGRVLRQADKIDPRVTAEQSRTFKGCHADRDQASPTSQRVIPESGLPLRLDIIRTQRVR